MSDPGTNKMASSPGNGPSDTASSAPSETIQLKRTLGLFSGVALILGTIVGSGIFVSPKGVLIESGSLGTALIVWTLCGLICLMGALCFAELGTIIQRSGGMYAYIHEAFGDFAGFLYLWCALWVIFPAANAVISLTCAQYLLYPLFPGCEAPYWAVRLVAASVIGFLTFVNCISVKAAARIQNIFTVIKTLALFIIIITGLVVLAQGRVQNFDNAFDGSRSGAGPIALAFYSGMFSYSGWYTLNFLTEELVNPYENLPRAIWIALPSVTFIYVMSNVAYFAVLTQPEIIASDAVAVTFADEMFGIMSWVMPLFVAFSTFGSLNGCIMSVSRLVFVGARNSHLPQLLSFINCNKFTPLPAVIFEGLVSAMLLFIGDIFVLINCVSFVEALAFLVCTLALLVFRRRHPEWERPIKVHLALPVVFLLICTFLVVVPVFTSPGDTLLGIAFLLSGVPVYVVCVMWKKKPRTVNRFMDNLNRNVQKLILGVHQEGKID